jgi:hypothetical protein
LNGLGKNKSFFVLRKNRLFSKKTERKLFPLPFFICPNSENLGVLENAARILILACECHDLSFA